MKYTIIWETRECKEVELEASGFDEARAIWQEEAGENDYILSIEDEWGMRLEYGYDHQEELK